MYLNLKRLNHCVNSGETNDKFNQNFDWVIYVPATNQLISVSNITSLQTSSTEGGTCFNPINSFVQDGMFVTAQLYDHGQFYNSGWFLFIHK
jgi:hypothetical protein